MKSFNFLTVTLFVAGVLLSGNTIAQTTNFVDGGNQIIRNSSLVTYTVANPELNASFRWTVTGGTIVDGGADRTSPYDQTNVTTATTSIQIRWDNTNKTSANIGTLTVSKTVGTLSCPSTTFTLNVESWVDPSVSATTTNSSVCSGSAPTFDLTFQGKSNYGYTWQVVNASGTVVQGPSTVSNIATSTTTVAPTGITNTSGTAANYQLQITSMQDGFSDKTSNATVSVAFTVNPVPTISNINSSSSLTPRP